MGKTAAELNGLKKDELVILFLGFQEQASNEIQKLSEELAEANSDITVASEKNADLQKSLDEKETELSSSLELLKELNEKLSQADQAAPAAELPSVKIGKKEFVMTIPKASYKGQDVTIEILSEDAELAKKLVEIGVGYLIEKEAK